MNDSATAGRSDQLHKPEMRFQQLREAFTNTALNTLGVVALVAIANNFWRATHSGWTASYTNTLLLACCYLAIMVFRKKLSVEIKGGALILLLFAAGTLGIYQLGLGSIGFMWLPLTCFVSAMLFSERVTNLVILLCILSLIALGYGYVRGGLTPDQNLAEYATWASSWAYHLLVGLCTCLIIGLTAGSFRNSLLAMTKEIASQRDQIEHLASHDNLTGLPTLRLAADRSDMAIANAKRANQKVAMMFIDLDGFKAINDTYGHEAGDHVLREVATRLRASVRAADTAARIGGDEFVIILTALQDGSFAGAVADKIIHAVSMPIAYEGKQLQVGASIGISIFPDHAQDGEGLKKAADEAMYVVKKSGKNAFAFAKAALSNPA